MTAAPDDEAYARAALTYLAERADQLLGALVRARGAAAVLDAIKTGHPLRSVAPGSLANAERAKSRWRADLRKVPSPGRVAAFEMILGMALPPVPSLEQVKERQVVTTSART